MLALAGYPLDCTCRFLEPAAESSAAQVGERIQGDFEEIAALTAFAAGLDAATYEFENVPIAAVHWLAERVAVWPPPAALAIAQERVAEKRFFESLGIPVAAFAAIASRADFDQALRTIGLPAILKTIRLGYDGKGQQQLRVQADAERAWEQLGGQPLILEAFVPFERELSIVAVRGQDGAVAFYPLVENQHRDGILRRTTAPAPRLSPRLQDQAENYARRVLEATNYVGVLAIELFEKGAELLVNEMAPRVHNSGHWTIEGAETSQFENHLRAVGGVPLGSTKALGGCEMFNLIGELPSIPEVLKIPGAHVHLYGKTPQPNRKLGHITLRGGGEHAVRQLAEQLD
jgi:5-(carboxyamino)imidazole ribonucleotide synthase